MALLYWRDTFNTGIPSVDYEHKHLIDIINQLYEKIRHDDVAEVNEFFAALHDRIAAHFALEERVMKERRYEGYTEHKADHERLLDEIRNLMEEHYKGAYLNASDVLAQRLERWFSIHFNTMDIRLHRAIGDVQSDGSADRS